MTAAASLRESCKKGLRVLAMGSALLHLVTELMSDVPTNRLSFFMSAKNLTGDPIAPAYSLRSDGLIDAVL